jgi:hypothetical protein
MRSDGDSNGEPRMRPGTRADRDIRIGGDQYVSDKQTISHDSHNITNHIVIGGVWLVISVLIISVALVWRARAEDNQVPGPEPQTTSTPDSTRPATSGSTAPLLISDNVPLVPYTIKAWEKETPASESDACSREITHSPGTNLHYQVCVHHTTSGWYGGLFVTNDSDTGELTDFAWAYWSSADKASAPILEKAWFALRISIPPRTNRYIIGMNGQPPTERCTGVQGREINLAEPAPWLRSPTVMANGEHTGAICRASDAWPGSPDLAFPANPADLMHQIQAVIGTKPSFADFATLADRRNDIPPGRWITVACRMKGPAFGGSFGDWWYLVQDEPWAYRWVVANSYVARTLRDGHRVATYDGTADPDVDTAVPVCRNLTSDAGGAPRAAPASEATAPRALRR